MRELGLDLTRHETQPFTEQMARHADFILAMTQGHLQAIIQRWPAAAERAHLVRPDGIDVADPIGLPIGAYRQCAEEIETAAKYHAERILQELGTAKR
jgi:protein-tyrosine phosphatase